MSDDLSPEGGDLHEPEPHGQAALLLVESLIHGLTARCILTVGQAIEILEIARDAQVAIAEDAGVGGETKAVTLLTAIVHSLRMDAPAEDSSLRGDVSIPQP